MHRLGQRPNGARARATPVLWALLVVASAGVTLNGIWPSGATLAGAQPRVTRVALYPEDKRRPMTTQDYRRFPGAGVLFCRDDDNVPRPAAASWLIGSRSLVMMNAHNFLDRHAAATRGIEDCFFQIDGRNYEFDAKSLVFGVPRDATSLHITDDWALARLREPADVEPQPIPGAPKLATGDEVVEVTMVSPAGHGNFRGTSSIETCEIRRIDPPSQDGIRRVRHDCNDGYGGSGSGLFDEGGNILAMQSASLDMNRRMSFDIEGHYGSALIIEGELRRTLLREVSAGR